MSVADRFRTHDVENQPPELAPYDAWATDLPLREALEREGGGWPTPHVAAYGAIIGGESMALAVAANDNRPTLRALDRTGARLVRCARSRGALMHSFASSSPSAAPTARSMPRWAYCGSRFATRIIRSR